MQPTHVQVTDTTVTPARTLRTAGLYLSEYGWVQGSYYDQAASVFTPAACMVGAIAMVCYGGPVEAPAQHFNAPEFGDFEAALAFLDRYLVGTTARAVECAYAYNDAPGRSREQVIKALDAAADAWELLHVRCPGCGEPAYSRPPTDWHLPQCWPVPNYSHRDGEPLCPVYGRDGVTPAMPVLRERNP
jgi:hypothetical protein